MTINLKMPDITELKPRITVFGVGGAGGNAVNNMIEAGLQGVDFVVANTDAQALTMTKADRLIQMGVAVTQGLGAGSQPEIGRAAAEETIDEIIDHLSGAHMAFITAGMGGGTGTGAAPIVARAAREAGILTVGVVTKPFQFEGQRRMRIADAGIVELQKHVDTLIVIPNQNLFRIANDKTTFADAFAMADEVLYSGVACITDLMVKDGLINLDFADVRSVMREMGKAMMGTGEASGDKRAIEAAEKAIANPLLDDVCMRGARGPADLHHRRPRHDAVRGRRGGEPRPRGGRRRRQHHLRRHLRRGPGRRHPRLGRGDRHRAGAGAGADRAADGRHGGARPPAEVGRRAGRAALSRSQRAARAGAGLCAGGARAGACRRRMAQRRSSAQPPPRRRRGLHRSRARPAIRRCGSARSVPTPRSSRRHSEAEAERARANEAARVAAAEHFIPPAAERPDSAAGAHAARRGLPAGGAAADAAQRHSPAREEERRPRGLLARLASGLARHRRGRGRALLRRPRGRARGHRAARASQAQQPVARRRPNIARRSRAASASRVAGRCGSIRAAGTIPVERAHEDELEIPAFLRRQSS